MNTEQIVREQVMGRKMRGVFIDFHSFHFSTSQSFADDHSHR